MLFERIPKEVEDEWLEILKEEGLDENVAKNVIAWIGGDARLMTGKPDEKTVEILKDVLEEISFKNLGIEDEESVKEQMIRVLETSLASVAPETEIKEVIPVLHSPRIPTKEVLEPKNPVDVIISNLLEANWEVIEEAYKKIGLKGVLRMFTRATFESYKGLLRIAIGDVLGTLIDDRIIEILRELEKRRR